MPQDHIKKQYIQLVDEISVLYAARRSCESAEGRLYVVCRELYVDLRRWKVLGRVMAQKTAFENLQVYQLAEQLSDLAWAAIKKWQYLEKDTIGKRLVRSSDSIGANIAEGTGRGSKKDNMRFAKIARGSLFEVKHWLRRAYKQELLSDSEVNKFQETLEILTPKISAYINSLAKKE